MTGAAVTLEDPWLEFAGLETGLWLAAVPQWTVELAGRACMPLPESVENAEALAGTLATNGVGSRRTELDDQADLVELFWVDGTTRQAWATAIAIASAGEEESLTRQFQHVIEQVRKAKDEGEYIPPATRRWLQLVASPAGTDGAALEEEVAQLVSSSDFTSAEGIVIAVKGISPLNGPSYVEAVDRASASIRLARRLTRDQQLLSGYKPISEQIRPLEAFLQAYKAPRDDDHATAEPWAIHLLGPGGVGKSMLVRYLAANRLAVHSGSEEEIAAPELGSVPIARVDFDHLTPDFPSYRPAELLVVLAQELRGYRGGPASDRLLEQFLIAARGVQATSSGGRIEWDDPTVIGTIDAFTDYLNSLPAPQILVLDTCEELEKLRPTGSDAPAVERTFALLERIASRCAGLRVVLAGRRYLASAGAGWNLPESVTQASVASQAARPYLQLLQVRGFNRTDAIEFLNDEGAVQKVGKRPSPRLVDAVLGRSPEIGPEGVAPSPDRYNPFLLDHYRAWWVEEPDLSAETIRESGTDSYIEGRILARIADPDVEELLPAFVVLFGQLDERAIQHWFGHLNEELVTRVTNRLAEQEWVELSTMPVSEVLSMTVSRGLWPLLRVWFLKEPNDARVASAARRLSDHLADRLRRDELGALTPELVMAALQTRAAPERPALWSELEARIAMSGRWDWSNAVLARVRGELPEELARDPILNATVLATEIAAKARVDGPTLTTGSWVELRAMLDSADDKARRSPAAELLRRRAGIWTGTFTQPAAVGLPDLLAALGSREEPVESVVGALETLLAPMSPPARLRLGLSEQAMRAAEIVYNRKISRPLAASALVAIASLLPYEDRGGPLDRAANLAQRAPRAQRSWADRPLFDGRDLRVWVALNQAWTALENGDVIAPKVLSRWSGMATRADRSSDSDRLLGCCIELSPLRAPAGWRSGAPDLGRSITNGADWLLDALHDFAPSHFVAIARYYYRRGSVQQAWVMLEDERQLAVSLTLDDAHVREVEDALVWLGARMRWESFMGSLKWAGRRRAGAPPDPYGIRSALLDALSVLADGETLDIEELRDRIDYTCPRWLCHDLALELDLLAMSPRWDGEAVPRAMQMRMRDPATALQLLTADALSKARLSQPSEAVIQHLREAYTELADLNDWPGWDDLDARREPPGNMTDWRTWVARWRTLKGLSPKRGELSIAASPEFPGEAGLFERSATSPRADVARRVRRPFSKWLRRLASTISSLALTVSVVVVIVGAVTLIDELGGPSWMSFVIVVLAGVGAGGWVYFSSGLRKQFMAWLLRAYAVDVYVTRTNPQNQDGGPDALLVPGLHLGRQAFPRRFFTIAVPRLLRRLTPAPELTPSEVELPLNAERGLGKLSFTGGPLALVLATYASGFDDDVMPGIFARTELGFGRCVVIHDTVGPLPAWPGRGVTLIAPDEWLGVLQLSYGAATEERYTTRMSVRNLVKDARVVHVLGLTTRTSRGPVVRLESTAGATKAPAWGSSFDASSAALLGSPWLTVLQTTPVDGPLARVSRSAKLQLTLAREVQHVTSGWVLTVPALPPALARKLWAALGEFAQLRKPRRRHLVRLVDALKADLLALAENGQAEPWVVETIARDVLLFGPWQET